MPSTYELGQLSVHLVFANTVHREVQIYSVVDSLLVGHDQSTGVEWQHLTDNIKVKLT